MLSFCHIFSAKISVVYKKKISLKIILHPVVNIILFKKLFFHLIFISYDLSGYL